MKTPPIFNPLSKINLGKSIVDALLESEAQPLEKVEISPGAGIYAIYYSGPFPLYKPLSRLNKTAATHPVYVGKAIPKGGRKGINLDASLDSNALTRRLVEHKNTIEAVKSLAITDFSY